DIAPDPVAVEPFHGELHTAGGAFARGRDHIVAVRRGAVAHDLAVNLCATRLCVLKLFQHDDAGAAGDDEAVAALVVGAACGRGGVVEPRVHGAHRVEQDR